MITCRRFPENIDNRHLRHVKENRNKVVRHKLPRVQIQDIEKKQCLHKVVIHLNKNELLTAQR